MGPRSGPLGRSAAGGYHVRHGPLAAAPPTRRAAARTEAVRRLPGEVGALYVEDKHRLDEARAALERVIGRWDGA